MYGETFKDALYGAFQPEDEEYDPSFLVRLLEYFPTDKVDVGSGTYDQYLYDLEKTVVDNYEKGNYQVSFFYAHLIFMSYTYYCVDHAFQTNPGRMKDLFYPINAYNGKKDKPDIENHASVYDFSKIPEKEIFKVFRALEMEDETIKALSKYISDRDDYAHATGQGNISVDALVQNIRTITKHMEALYGIFKGPAKDLYVQYLLIHCETEYSDVVDGVYDFIVDNMLSLHDLEYLCHLGISGIRNENEEFKSKYRFIKKVHCTFIEYCMENMGIDSPSSYTDLRDEAYLYYKYQDNAVEYVENELGVSAYECGKEGVEFPVYECLECGAEQLAHDTKAQKYHCFSCGEDFDESTISFCSQCGAIMKDNEIDICPNCIENITAD